MINQKTGSILTTVEGCARCGGVHQDIVFKKMSRPFRSYTHFTICPVSQDPILMRSVDDGVFNQISSLNTAITSNYSEEIATDLEILWPNFKEQPSGLRQEVLSKLSLAISESIVTVLSCYPSWTPRIPT